MVMVMMVVASSVLLVRAALRATIRRAAATAARLITVAGELIVFILGLDASGSIQMGCHRSRPA